LVSTNGPSVVSVLPSSTRTVVAVSGGCSRTPLGVTPGVSLFSLYPAAIDFCSSGGRFLISRPLRPRLLSSTYFMGFLLHGVIAYETNAERRDRQLGLWELSSLDR
jgi:hypothetical protein